jgi:HK97 family phage portal protein
MFFRRTLEKRESVGLNDPQLLEWLGITPGEVNVMGKKALKEATVFACIKILAESMSKLPLKIYQEDEHGINKAKKHYLYNLLKLRPNPYMSASDYEKCKEAQRNTYGNAYVSIEFDKRTGKIIALWPIDASKVKIWIDDVGLLRSNNRLWYEIDVGKGEKIKVMPDAIMHFKSGVTLDGIVGISPLDYLRSTVENAASAGKFINNFYKQGLQTKGIVQYVGDLNEEAKRKFRDNFESMSSGLKNSHRISLMPIGYQFVPMSLSMSDAQFIENTELTIRQIATAFGIKMHQLNDLSRATFTNVAEQQKHFYVDTLQPILTMYEQEMTHKLFLESELEAGYYVKYNVDAMLRADIQTRYNAYRTAIQGGFLKPNEARAKEELPPEEGGDRLLVNGNMMPIEMAGQQYLKKGGEETGKTEEGN